MSLTPAQLATLKADIAADPVLNAKPMTSGGAFEIAEAYKAATSTDVWRTEAPVSAVYDAIDWTKFTPTDAPDNTATFTNRALVIQTKQMNLQNMLQGRSAIDASKSNIRAGLRDAVIGLPAGASGAAISAGGTGGSAVLAALTRKANRFEKLFATQDATTGPTTAKLLVVEGDVTVDAVQAARES